MEKKEIRDWLADAKVIAVLRASEVEIARELAQAYVDGGIKAIELTTSIPSWETALKEVVRDCADDAVVGMGTISNSMDVIRAVDLGANFIVSPYTSLSVIEACSVHDTLVMPGALTPTEVANAYEYGADMVKIFPASNVGGPAYIKALKAPMPWAELIPTGGVSMDNAHEYFKAGAFAVGIGSNLAPKDKVINRDWDAVSDHVAVGLKLLREKLEEV